jgi:hypothetical protein
MNDQHQGFELTVQRVSNLIVFHWAPQAPVIAAQRDPFRDSCFVITRSSFLEMHSRLNFKLCKSGRYLSSIPQIVGLTRLIVGPLNCYVVKAGSAPARGVYHGHG